MAERVACGGRDERRTENWLPHYGIQFSVLSSPLFVLRLLEA